LLRRISDIVGVGTRAVGLLVEEIDSFLGW
jgi:hypothetical protein